jgi:ribosomal protein S17
LLARARQRLHGNVVVLHMRKEITVAESTPETLMKRLRAQRCRELHGNVAVHHCIANKIGEPMMRRPLSLNLVFIGRGAEGRLIR